MAKSLSDAVLDGSLALVVGDQISVCSTEPFTYADATVGDMLAITIGVGAGQFTISDGDVNGRKNQVTQQTGVSITNTGIATHVAITNLSGTLLKVVTTATSQALTSGGTVDIGTFKVEIADPV